MYLIHNLTMTFTFSNSNMTLPLNDSGCSCSCFYRIILCDMVGGYQIF